MYVEQFLIKGSINRGDVPLPRVKPPASYLFYPNYACHIDQFFILFNFKQKLNASQTWLEHVILIYEPYNIMYDHISSKIEV